MTRTVGNKDRSGSILLSMFRAETIVENCGAWNGLKRFPESNWKIFSQQLLNHPGHLPGGHNPLHRRRPGPPPSPSRCAGTAPESMDKTLATAVWDLGNPQVLRAHPRIRLSGLVAVTAGPLWSAALVMVGLNMMITFEFLNLLQT